MRQTTNNIARYVLMLFVLALAPRLAGGVVAAENETGTVTMLGDGTSTTPYQIGNYAQLVKFAALVNGGQKSICAVLTADINTGNNFIIDGSGNLTNTPDKHWIPIGNFSNQYTGTFDGQGHTITGLYVNDNSIQYVGLSGYLGEGGIIRNVGVKTSHFYNGKQFGCVGGVCGYSNKGTIENCYNEGEFSGTGTNNFVGGVCGSNSGPIKNCYNAGILSGTGTSSNIGGVCGSNSRGTIENCYNEGELSRTGTNSNVGGVCGNNSGTIENCYNAGTVWTDNNANIGGVCGKNSDNTIENCYYLAGTANSGIGDNSMNMNNSAQYMSEEDFKSGKVAWLLNGNKDDKAKTSPWLQDLSEEENGGDKFPVLKAKDAKCIAVVKKVTDTDVTYTNPDDHNYNNDTFADFPDYGTANLYSHVCDNCKGAAKEDKKEIRKLNSADDKIVITKNNGSDWTTGADITLGDDATDNWYHAPVEFTTTGTVTHTRAISTDWVTLCLPYEISTKKAANCKFYKLSNVVPSEKITLTEITEATIEAGTPVFVKRNDNNVNSIEIKASNVEMIQTPTEQTADNGKLVGTFNTMMLTMDDNGDCLFIKNDNMWSIGETRNMTVKPFRAYIVPDTPISAPKLSITIDGEATAISDALDTLNDTNAEYYDINGRRISSLQKGVNIIKSGNRTRKVIIK